MQGHQRSIPCDSERPIRNPHPVPKVHTGARKKRTRTRHHARTRQSEPNALLTGWRSKRHRKARTPSRFPKQSACWCSRRNERTIRKVLDTWEGRMFPNLEGKVLQSVGNTGLVLEPASGLDQEGDGRNWLAIVNGGDLSTAGGVNNGSKRACETCGVADGGGRRSQHWWTRGGRGKGMGWGRKSEGSRWWALTISLPLGTSLLFRRCPTRALTGTWTVKTLDGSQDSMESITRSCTYQRQIIGRRECAESPRKKSIPQFSKGTLSENVGRRGQPRAQKKDTEH